MRLPLVTVAKFVGTVSLGLATGVSYSLATLALPSLLFLPTAPSAAQTHAYLNAQAKRTERILSAVAISALTFAFVAAPSRGKHPYLLWTSLVCSAGLLPGLNRFVRRIGGQVEEESLEESGVIVGGSHGSDSGEDELVNGEMVRRGVERGRVVEGVRAGILGLAFTMSVVGLWGDAAGRAYFEVLEIPDTRHLTTPINALHASREYSLRYSRKQTYQKSPLLQDDSNAAETIRSCFQRLTTILQDEARSPAPHLCLSFAASSQIYTTVSRIGAVAQNEGIIREAVAVFGALIDSEEEEFLANEKFAKSLMLFVDRTSGSGNLFVGEDTEGEIVELLFGIAAKIRLEPEILSVWFNEKHDPVSRRNQGTKNDFVGVTSKEDFPLCYQLIDHVHHEGRIGDFARTGLLYIFESASKSKELEQWIVESDLPTLMASGLGALYSQLSRKLSILHPPEHLPIILSLSDYRDLPVPTEAENLFSANLQGHLSTFLSYLTFWQDVLEHCRSMDVRQTLLNHLQVLFLQQLLYPSMLESSDIDGGSSVAVLTYLRRILDVLDHAEMVDLVLQYLLALPAQVRPKSPQSTNRRTSLLLLTQMENEDDRPNPELFNLVDLIRNSVTSANPQTVVAALRLATVLLGKNHPYAIDTLVQTSPAHPDEQIRTHGALGVEMEKYLHLAQNIGGEAGLDDAYAGHLKDTLRAVESHICSSRRLALHGLGISTAQAVSLIGNREVIPHFVRLDDPFLAHSLSILKHFLTNNVEVNLALTENIIGLMSCPHFRLEGWVSVHPSNYSFSLQEEESTKESEALHRLKQFRQPPTWSASQSPKLMTVLESLQTEIHQLRTSIPNLNDQVTARKQAFRLYSDINEAIQNTASQNLSSRQSQDLQAFPIPASSQSKPVAFPPRVSSLAETPSRSLSPRGRPTVKEQGQAPTSSPGPMGRSILSQYAPGLDVSLASPASRSRVRSSETSRMVSDREATVTGEEIPQTILADVIEAANSAELSRRIRFPLHLFNVSDAVNSTTKDEERGHELDGATPSVANGPQDEEGVIETQTSFETSHPAAPDVPSRVEREASLGHIVTNIVILQEFILEIVAVMQIRGSLFGEVQFA